MSQHALGPAINEVKSNQAQYNDYDWLQQFDEDAEGLRFTEIDFQRMKGSHGETVRDGIAGDRWMREHARTDILNNNLSREHFERGLTVDEMNDLIDYYAWNIYDVLALRGTEGKSKLIPRQEYEFFSYTMEFLRYPEFFKAIVDDIGINGLIEIGRESRTTMGTKINSVHLWCLMVAVSNGAVALEAADFVDPEDPLIVDKKRWYITVSNALLYGYRNEQGHVLCSQNRYATQTKDSEVLEFVRDRLQPLEGTEKAQFRQLNAASELLSFLIHYDCRLGLGDTGPYITEDGKPMIIRDHFINEPAFSWSKVSEDRDLPYCITLAFVIDPKEVGRDSEELQELRVNDISTTFSRPDDYMGGVEAGAVFVREEVEQPESLPVDDLKQVDIEDFTDITVRCNEAIEDWYRITSKLPRRQKIMNGAWVYYTGMILPLLRVNGTYDKFCNEFDLWEVPPMSSDIYYTCWGELAQEVIPVDILQGLGQSEIPHETKAESDYADHLAEIWEHGWNSDLTGMLDIPEEWEAMMDENRLIQDVDITKMD